MKEQIKLFLDDLRNLIVTGILLLYPKDKSTWVFGAWFGEAYADNSKYLFEYVCKNHPEIHAVWLARTRDVYDLVRSKGFPVYMFDSQKGKEQLRKAAIGVTSSGCYDVNNCLDAKIQWIYLSHGTPLKKIFYDIEQKNYVEDGSFFQELYRKIFRKKKKDTEFKNAMFIATSEESRAKVSSGFRAPIEHVEITGYPRNDAFFQDVDMSIPMIQKISDLKSAEKKIAIYMPTFRVWNQFDPNRLQLSNLAFIDKYLEKLNCVLLLKLHHGEIKQLDSLDLSSYRNIMPVSNESIQYDIYPVLKLTDVLITDYSGVYFDYLIMDKPIIFAPFDMEKYNKQIKTFYYDYDSVTPGPKAKDWHEVMIHLDKILNGDDIYKSDRAEMNKTFNLYRDGNNSRRVFEKINEKFYRKGIS